MSEDHEGFVHPKGQLIFALDQQANKEPHVFGQTPCVTIAPGGCLHRAPLLPGILLLSRSLARLVLGRRRALGVEGKQRRMAMSEQVGFRIEATQVDIRPDVDDIL